MTDLNNTDYSTKKLFAFDLDGTLTLSKTNIDSEMANLICKLLEFKLVAVIGGGSYNQFKHQFSKFLPCSDNLSKLFLLPTSGLSFYKFENGSWQLEYQNNLTVEERAEIKDKVSTALIELNYKTPDHVYGEIIEDRGTQITFSALGQKAPLEEKENWNKNFDIRPKIIESLEKSLKGFEARMGGLTSIDITKKNVDKAYAIIELEKKLDLTPNEIVFFGDAVYEGGNDNEAIRSGVETVKISGPEEVKNIIRKTLK